MLVVAVMMLSVHVGLGRGGCHGRAGGREAVIWRQEGRAVVTEPDAMDSAAPSAAASCAHSITIGIPMRG